MKLKSINLTHDLINTQNVDLGAAGLQASVSPFDVPQSMSFAVDSELNVLILVFKYLGGEESEHLERINDDQLVFMIGKKSNRLYQIKIKLS